MGVSSTNKIPLSRPVITDEMIDAAANALRNERLVLGESVYRFEEAFARYIGTDHAISVSSGTAALTLALLALNIKNQEVITTPLSFIATANAVVHAGGIPRFADVSDQDFNINPIEIPKRISEKTSTILPVHLFGYPCQMDEIHEIARSRELKIVEDAAQAHGAVFRGKKVGSIGDVGCFSFYSSKNMTVGGDGGMVTTNDDSLAKAIAKLRDCGRISRYLHDVFGFTARLNTINAAIGLVQLKYLDEWNEKRRTIAKYYAKQLEDLPQIRLPPMGTTDVHPVFHLFVIRCEKRDELAKYLESKGVECGIHYPVPIHLQPIYVETFGHAPGMFPVSEALSKNLLSLPMFPTLSFNDVRYVCQEIFNFYGGSGR
ncbi:MAG: DegT/DnrJ/EryC1/StrS family aminotransferase [Methanomassiliicoccales archaeon]|nr:DegT/DnrJ/EryC1/StrS family aminotransferase [Methanomassiliicoccales archaeon]